MLIKRRAYLLVLVFLFFNTTCAQAGLNAEAGRLSASIAELMIRLDKLFERADEYNRMDEGEKLLRGATNVYKVQRTIGAVPMAYGSGGTWSVDGMNLVQTVMNVPEMKFFDQVEKLLTLTEEFQSLMSEIKKLHSKHLSAYRLWICITHYQSHIGYKFQAVGSPDYFYAHSPPVEAYFQFLHLLGEVLSCLFVYCDNPEPAVQEAYTILERRMQGYSSKEGLLSFSRYE